MGLSKEDERTAALAEKAIRGDYDNGGDPDQGHGAAS
jgi:hypothetical protein